MIKSIKKKREFVLTKLLNYIKNIYRLYISTAKKQSNSPFLWLFDAFLTFITKKKNKIKATQK